MVRQKKKSLSLQVLEYFISGGAFFWSGYIAFAFFYSAFGWPLFIAKQLANLIGLSINYILESRWVFTVKSSKKLKQRRPSRYIIITIINFGIDYLIVAGLKQKGITPYIGQFVSAGFFTGWNFVWYKYWVFAAHTPKHRKVRR